MSQQLINGLLAAFPIPAVLIDHSERCIGVNREGISLLGMNVLGRNFATFLRQPAVASAIETCLSDQKPQSALHVALDGTQDATFEVSVKFVPGVGSNAAGAALLCFADVTEREQASQMRRDFVANVSHELRTPLTALIGFIETLRGAAKSDENARDKFLTIMQSEASRMNRLVGDLLTLNRVESGERVRPKQKTDLSALLNSTLRSLEPLAKTAGVELKYEDVASPLFIPGDPDQLQQVFTNLIENSIKYGGDEVLVSLAILDREPALRSSAVQVQVSNNGPSIAPHHLPRLTERFYRADGHRSRELGGTGLGLAIVKHIVNRHRGRLRVESELGQGATFTVVIPK